MFRAKTCLILAAGFIVACDGKPGQDEVVLSPNERVPANTNETADYRTNNENSAGTPSPSDNGRAQVTRSADSHTHGDANLAVVVEGNVVTIELDSPLYNILGFENVPDTDLQKSIVSQAETQLRQGSKLFTFNDEARCQVGSENQSVQLFDENNGDEHDDHRDDHNHAEDEEHSHSEGHEESTHKDLILRYEFECQTPSKISNISVNLFDYFEQLSELNVTFLGPTTQQQMTLNHRHTRMDLSK
ncbi:DUF2796 domain-containing protein [Litorimonas haliclonae]|uniref:DUF2796 domain-containing protein n=1 Tax=Litorimonas haliclonae TaxID=2081977 RepID=UPI0039EF0E4C